MKKILLTKHLDSTKTLSLLVTTLVFAWFSINIQQARAGEPKPAVEITSLFRMNLFPTGSLNIQELDLIFASKDSSVQVVVKTAVGKEVHSFKNYPGFKVSKEAFARVNMDGYSQAKLEAGDYIIETIVNGEIVTHLPFSVENEASNDPFATTKKVHFTGAWQDLGYLHYTKSHNFTANTDYQLLNLRIWGGFGDLPSGSSGEKLLATLTQDQKVFGHSKKSSGFLSLNKEINRVDLVMFKPHTDKTAANVLGVSQAELIQGNHNYHLTIVRQDDGKVIRDFEFESKDGKLVPLARTELGHMPQHNYLAPRALIHGTHNYEFEPIYWLENKK